MIKQILRENSDLEYKKYLERILPGVNNIMGVKLVILKEIARNLDKSDFNQLDNSSFEMIMLRGLLITNMSLDDYERLVYIDEYVSQLSNWYHCDIFTKYLKGVEMDTLLSYVYQYKEFSQRFALVMFANRFITSRHINVVIHAIEHMEPRGYYSKTAFGSLISSIYRDFPELIENWLKTSTHSYAIINLSITRICASSQIDEDTKKRFRKFKRFSKG